MGPKSVSSSIAPGTILGRKVSVAQEVVGVAEADLASLDPLKFRVPDDAEVKVRARISGVGAGTASATVTIKLTDEANAVKDSDFQRSGTASRNYIQILLEEVIPAGSGIVTRKLRGVCTAADGVANVAATGRITLEAIVQPILG